MKSVSILNSGIYAACPKKINKHIEIVSSTVPGLSSMNEESREAVYRVLIKFYKKVSITIINTQMDLEALVALRPDLVFLGMRYIPTDPNKPRGHSRIWLSAYLEKHNIAITGSGQSAHKLELNKTLAKQRVLAAGLNTAPFFVVKQNQLNIKYDDLPFPLFVKPNDRGGGQGIDNSSVARDPAALQLKIADIANNLQADALIEKYLPGREFSVAILRNELTDKFSVMPVELAAEPDANGVSLLSREVKSSNAEVVSLVADTTVRTNICALALAAFHALGGQDYGRIDIRLDGSGESHFLEANLLPSLIRNYGSFPKACLMNRRLDYKEMILTIVRLALLKKNNGIQHNSIYARSILTMPAPLEPIVLN